MNILFENVLQVPMALSIDETTTFPISVFACHKAIASTKILFGKNLIFIYKSSDPNASGFYIKWEKNKKKLP